MSEQTMSRNSSLNAVTGYRLDDGGSILSRGSNFSLRHSVQFGSGARRASCPMGTQAFPPNVKAATV
jgi:hypothetical protein